MTKEQAISYGAGLATGGGGFLARMSQEVAQWSAMDLLTAVCMTAGFIGVVVRIYVDVSAHRDRKTGLERRQTVRAKQES